MSALQRLAREAFDVPLVLVVEFLEKIAGEKQRVSVALAERWNAQLDLVEAIEEIFAKAAIGDELVEILVGGADDADIDTVLLSPADPLDDMVLQETQRLDLHGQRQIADFVEEKRTLVRFLDLADRLAHRAGEGALLVAEELAFEQGLRDRRAIDRDERALPAHAQAVKRVRQQLLPGAALPQQQDRNIGRGDLLHHAEKPHHRVAAAQNAVDGRARLCRGGEPAILGLQFLQVERALDDQAENVDVDRLLEKIVGAERDALERVFAVLVAGGDDDLGVRRKLAQRLERRQALGRAVGIGRQAEIDDRDRRGRAARQRDRFFPRAREDELVIRQRPAILPAQPFVVLEDQHAAFVAGHRLRRRGDAGLAARARRATRMVVPAPGRVITSSCPPAARINSRV